jgi:porphyrinogen peroxidase
MRRMGFDISMTATCFGFVDGTENPRDGAALNAALVAGEDPQFAGGSYVIIQKYLHDIGRWNVSV